ncbi:CehA/McbA family metallohydrolase [Chondromyces crocatus]|uniref:Uncharacterized protein n=1 Tax=Chondromyces crocatus TaxID=52 RepID=A0A0K1ET65_CHOCO|nr:CehA/McbA family metallohydrolase [Chondromyces crocatus]AKT43823.1 uncharacterized protein CMC5_080600 [Chondromyces crocatus]
MRWRSHLGLLPFALLTATPGCSGDDDEKKTPPPSNPCEVPAVFEAGSAEGHADPLGAKAAGQARAGRIRDGASFPQPAHGRQQIQTGDIVLINDKISVVIEDAGISDGYGRYGGEIIAIDKVGDDGRPMGVSRYLETLAGLGTESILPEEVSVLNDGSNGEAAVVRVSGVLSPIPFIKDSLGAILASYGLRAAHDFILEPGAERVRVVLHVVNDREQELNFGVDREGSDELVGFFHASQSQMMTPEFGFQDPDGVVSWVGFDGGPFGFAWRSPRGPMDFALFISGFALFLGPAFVADACSVTTVEHGEFIAGGPHYDGLREAIRRVDEEAPWREVRGKVTDADGLPVAGAWVHAESAGGEYLSRVVADDEGNYLLHAPPTDDVVLIPQLRGYPPHDGTVVPPGESEAVLSFEPHGIIHVVATDAPNGEPLPVRVQVIPASSLPATPRTYGVKDEVGGRLHQDFAVTGEAHLIVPPGQHQVLVTRGYEWELFDMQVTVDAGQTVDVPVALEHSVDTSGVFCADFHMHAWFSADSSDPVDYKVKGAIADGLDIPVSSEHDWVADFQPVIERLGLTSWAFGVASQELTTFKFGHFGILPLEPKPGQLNNGAVDWIDLTPQEVFDSAHKQAEDPLVIVNHPSGSSFSGYFRASSYDRKKGSGSPDLWSDHFEAVEVFNESDFEDNRNESVADWFSLLNHGHKFWATGASDSHEQRTNPSGYPRTCLLFGHDDITALTPKAVRDVMAAGAATVSGGLFMTVAGPGGETPGEMVTTTNGKATFTVTVQAPSWVGADTLETIVNGETISVEPLMPIGNGQPGKRFMTQVEVSRDASRDVNWVVFHAKGDADLAPLRPGRRPFAVSNPVFLR